MSVISLFLASVLTVLGPNVSAVNNCCCGPQCACVVCECDGVCTAETCTCDACDGACCDCCAE